MNTPRSALPKRYNKHQPRKKGVPLLPEGHFTSSLLRAEKHATLVGQIIAYMPHLEERMIEFMALLGGDKKMPARQIFRSIASETTRIDIMRAMLEHSPQNVSKGPEYDEILRLFDIVRKARNTYAHGLWYAHDDERAFIQEASPDELAFFDQREVKLKELEQTLDRMGELWARIVKLIYPTQTSALASKTNRPRQRS